MNNDPNIPASHKAYLPDSEDVLDEAPTEAAETASADAAPRAEEPQKPQAEEQPQPAAQPVYAPQAPQKPTAKGPAAASPIAKWVENLSLTLSAVFSPLLVPTYACAIALWITPLSQVSERTRFLVCTYIFVLTAALPMALILFLIRKGKVADSAIINRKERVVPFFFTALCYIAANILLYYMHAPQWLALFYGGATFVLGVALLINNIWKISAHSLSMGGLCALVFYIAFWHLGCVNMLPWIIGAVLLTGLVGASRLLLGRHTPGQVYAGIILGFALEYIFMSI